MPMNIAQIIIIPMDFADTLLHLVTLLDPFNPFKDIVPSIADGDLGALTPGAVATPRQFRPPASWIWWGGAWTTWKASPCRGILHGDCKHMLTTPTEL